LAAGMKAAYPFIDDFLPAGTLDSLERLGEVLGGASQGSASQGSASLGSSRRGAAVNHASTPSPSMGLIAPEPVLPKPLFTTVMPTQARPLG